jgi:uncharacterized membrane protein
MRAGWKPLYGWITIVLLHAAQTIYYYPRLPAVVAQHYGAGGQPNGWAPREFFFIFSWVLLLGLSAVFMFTPSLLRRLPVSLINLPNRKYWLAEERKDESLRFLEEEMQWMGVLTIAFIVLVLHLAIRANLNPEHRLDNTVFVALLVGFLLSTVWWIARLYRRFPAPASAK